MPGEDLRVAERDSCIEGVGDGRQVGRVKEATFPRTKRLVDFDTRPLPDLPLAALAHLASGTWIDKGEPLVLLSDSGTGKAS